MDDNCAYIFESELRAMCFQASQHPYSETGGDLYGTWTYGNRPIIYLATGPGPKSSADATKFFQDNEYIMENERLLFENFGIQYLGDWHSHHTLGLHNPSEGDQRRINNIMIKSKRDNMIEIIITHVVSSHSPTCEFKKSFKERALAYRYNSMPSFCMNSCDIRLLKTENSVVRQKLLSDKRFLSINLMEISPELKIDNIQLSNKNLYCAKNDAEINCFLDIISALKTR